MNNSLVDNLALGGYWDEFCIVCQKHTYQPEGFCSVCGWDDRAQDYMTEERYNNCESFADVVDRVCDRNEFMGRDSKKAARKK